MAFTRPEWVSHTVSVEDMTAGKNQWRNIQDIVRVTFKEFHDVLRAQGDAIKSLERAIDSKADRSELGRGLSRSQLPEVEAACTSALVALKSSWCPMSEEMCLS